MQALTTKKEFFSKLSDLIVRTKYYEVRTKYAEKKKKKKKNDLDVIYIFQYKKDHNVYYIVRNNSFRNRLTNNISKYKFEKFQIISRNLG
jgi:hypothetical protein